MEEIVLSAVRAAMMSVKAPSAYDKVYKVRPVVFSHKFKTKEEDR